MGGTTVTIFGKGFERHAPGSCRFGLSELTSAYSTLNNTWSGTSIPTARYQSARSVVCMAPSSSISARARSQQLNFTQATTFAFQAASAATKQAAAQRRLAKEDDEASKPAWRAGGVTQTRRGEKQTTNPFAYGDGRFVGKHR